MTFVKFSTEIAPESPQKWFVDCIEFDSSKRIFLGHMFGFRHLEGELRDSKGLLPVLLIFLGVNVWLAWFDNLVQIYRICRPLGIAALNYDNVI